MNRHGIHRWNWRGSEKVCLVLAAEKNVQETIVLSKHAYSFKGVKIYVAEGWSCFGFNVLFVKFHAAVMNSNMVRMMWHTSFIKCNDRSDIYSLHSSLLYMLLHMPLHHLSRPYHWSILTLLIIYYLMPPKSLLLSRPCHLNSTLLAQTVVASVAED